MRELLAWRKNEMHMVQVSSCIHRLGRLINTVSSVTLPLYSGVSNQRRGSGSSPTDFERSHMHLDELNKSCLLQASTWNCKERVLSVACSCPAKSNWTTITSTLAGAAGKALPLSAQSKSMSSKVPHA